MVNIFSKEQLLQLYKQMALIREFEESASILYSEGLVTSALHTCIGEEATAVGICAALKPEDIVVSNHRGHGHCIAKGLPINEMMAELLGKRTGICKGKSGSMHLFGMQQGLYGCNGIVGANLPIATGIGMAMKYNNTKQVCAVFFGDGASNEGTFHEAINMASIWKLPVIFVCENNGYAISVPVTKSTSVTNIADRAEGYGIRGVVVDGMDMVAVYSTAKKLIKAAREGNGPCLIECKTYRFRGHSRGDPPYGPYRSKEEFEKWFSRDPLNIMVSTGLVDEEKSIQIKSEAQRIINDAVAFAKSSPIPDLSEALTDIYA